MKRILLVAMALILVAAAVEVARAEESEMQGSMMQKKMGHKGMMGDKMKQGMNSPKMMGKSLVATEDGGVVVMIGPKLLKYDQNLNLVKEATIDIKKMHEEMKQMMKDCPGCKEGQTEE